MGLITYFEPNWQRTVRAAYAESKSNAITEAAVQNVGILIENNCYIYRIEDTSNGSFVGFVVYQGNGVPTFNYNGDMIPKTGHIRPQFNIAPINAEYNLILTTTINNNI
jgi:hypothetical protein